MKKNIPKISVIIITYNQEKLITRAIDSLLCQNNYVYEIIISDDCSNDSTWEIVNKYKTIYPNLIFPFRNEYNLGIFGNIEKSREYVSGDILFYLAGDDIFNENLFKNTLDLIEEYKIDYLNEAFIVLFDFLSHNPNGREKMFSNSRVINGETVSLKIRNLIFNRSMGVSKKVYQKYFCINKEIGICAEGLIGIQPHLFATKYYYKSFIGSVYFSNIGVSVKIDKKEHIISYLRYYDVLLEILENHIRLNKKDIKWINYSKMKYTFRLNPNMINLMKYFCNLLMTIDFHFGFKFFIREYKTFFVDILRYKLKM